MSSAASSCVDCRFGQCAQRTWPGWPGGLWTKPTPDVTEDIVICRRQPCTVNKKPSDWCGEHQPRILAKEIGE